MCRVEEVKVEVPPVTVKTSIIEKEEDDDLDVRMRRLCDCRYQVMDGERRVTTIFLFPIKMYCFTFVFIETPMLKLPIPS